MIIGFTYNLKPCLPAGMAKKFDIGDKEAEFYAEFDTPETIKAIEEAIVANGYKVIRIEANELAYNKLRRLRNKIDLVFNFAEAASKSADREAHIPMFCEILHIPYTGPGPLSAALILNKARAKEIWDYYGVPTPPFQVFYTTEEKLDPALKFPLIAKTNGQGSSSGVRNKSVVKNQKELRETVTELMDQFKEPVLVEKFLSGREFTIPILGNDGDLWALPIAESNFKALPKGVNRIDSYEAKWIWDDPSNPLEAMICPAKISNDLKNEIVNTAKKAFITIGCRDWARIDLRLDGKGKLYVLEINCPVGLLPDLKENSKLPRSAHEAGLNFDQLIGKIIEIAKKRLNLP
ncbi:MAG: D-alanine--D-alanine ligase [Candidatus Shapirobacteria bacterium]|nr:D-alanine--D-alanine ligase [Candidatus Shapirobacteria bacterium]